MKYIYKKVCEVPERYAADVSHLKTYMEIVLGIEASTSDVYQLWSSISEDYEAGWLHIDFLPEGETREEFIIEMMSKYGYLM